MKIDPVIAEVRRVREELCRRFDNDPKKLFAYLQGRSLRRANERSKKPDEEGNALALREQAGENQ
jgi:hypothetical protein